MSADTPKSDAPSTENLLRDNGELMRECKHLVNFMGPAATIPEPLKPTHDFLTRIVKEKWTMEDVEALKKEWPRQKANISHPIEALQDAHKSVEAALSLAEAKLTTGLKK